MTDQVDEQKANTCTALRDSFDMMIKFASAARLVLLCFTLVHYASIARGPPKASTFSEFGFKILDIVVSV